MSQSNICGTGHYQCTGCYYCEERDNHTASCWFLEDAKWLIDWAFQTYEYQRYRGGFPIRWYYGRKEVIETALDYPLFIDHKFWDLWRTAKSGLKELGFGVFKEKNDVEFFLFYDVSKIEKLKNAKTELEVENRK